MRARAYIAALPALINAQRREEYFREYIAEGIRLISENTAKFAGGSYVTARYKPVREAKKEEKQLSAGQAVERMCKRLGGWKK